MILTNTKNRKEKQPGIYDIVFINGDKYQITGETATKKGWRLNKIDGNPKTKQKESWNKNTFAKKFYFDGEKWSFIRKCKVPNLDYL